MTITLTQIVAAVVVSLVLIVIALSAGSPNTVAAQICVVLWLMRWSAKLNLFLHITGQRADGYHTLQTLFQLLDYGDELSFTLRRDGEITLR